MGETRFEQLAKAVRGEFRDMPGLHLTRAQLQRLYSMDAPTCNQLLARLVSEHFLALTESNRFCRADESSAATR